MKMYVYQYPNYHGAGVFFASEPPDMELYDINAQCLGTIEIEPLHQTNEYSKSNDGSSNG